MKIPLLVASTFFFISLANPLNPSLNDDVLGLVFFKSGLQDPAAKLSSWNVDDSNPCNWAGVNCSRRSKRVTELALDGFGLSGKLGRGLLRLKFLRKLWLSRNNFTGNLNTEFAHISNLTLLDLSDNGFDGFIPDEMFTQCDSLRSISVARNGLSGPIPETLASCSSLVSLDFSSNQLSGPLPSGLWSLSGLRSLDFSGNDLEGEISEGIGSLKSLRTLRLGSNKFSGGVPDGIGDCSLLRSIDLSRNSFSGELPSKMQMSSLENLDLSGNNFSGEIPDSFGKLRSLKLLNVSNNALVGNFPEGLSACENLSTLDGSRNSLTGDFPYWVLKLGLQQVSVSENGLTGGLENAFRSSGEISREKLLVLDVSRNKLTGGIPFEVGFFKSLIVLDLSENQLNGSIPFEIGSSNSLISLSLAHNEISGSIPSSLANLTHLQTLDFSFNKLTGPLPKQLANLSTLRSFNISHNQLQGELPTSKFFNTIDPSSISFNPALCGVIVNKTCPTTLPKPIVLNPNSTHPTTPDNNPNTPFPHRKKILSISALIAIGAAASIVVGVISITVLNLRARGPAHRSASAALDFSGGYDFSRSSPSTDGGRSGKLVMFSSGRAHDFSSGTHALLHKGCELGRGGFGPVYRAVLGDGLPPVAIKKLTVSSLVKSKEDFEREVKKLSRARHENLVALDGYYWTPSLQLLIYEFVSGGNLHKHLHEEKNLAWARRFDVIVGVAKGLASLHRMGIIHYNLKSSNILISDSGEVKVADYGLAGLLPMLDRYVLSSKIQSALGYMAPEFACKAVKITEKCDVYGFGILVLEVVTGKRPVEYMEDDVVVLSDMVRGAMEEGKVEECFDFGLRGIKEVFPVVKLGLMCTSQVPSARPDMAEVVEILEVMRGPLGEFS